ncbi:TIR domain-containing protein [uncultured Rubinisphaera sp.]|uniref:TIR domain-containing protein n=1 Tax=uncultured Rubinisphaera sp. TaxID=1678686 RepID=UPI0030DDC4AC
MSNSSQNSKRRHVFISHHHKDDAGVDKLTRLLSRKGYDIRNSSIRAKPANQARLDNGLVRPEVIRRLLRSKITWAGTLVVLIGSKTSTRPWVNWEIEQAHKQGKRIVGVWEQGGTEADVPKNLEKYADAVVGWHSNRIIDAIDGKIDSGEKPDGSVWPKRNIDRINCQ